MDKKNEEFQLKTWRGYDFFEVASALQKEIRRGNEHDALYWAFQMIPDYEKYLWKRLKIIVNEDIGLAYPMAIVLVQTLSEQYFEVRQKKGADATLFIANAIMIMCRAPKSRVADHFVMMMMQKIAQKKIYLEIPDYALDQHTKAGKKKGRGWEHFREIGSQITPKDESVEDPYEEEAYELLKNFKHWNLATGFHRDKKNKEDKNGKLFKT